MNGLHIFGEKELSAQELELQVADAYILLECYSVTNNVPEYV
jgi:hypothetical protein